MIMLLCGCQNPMRWLCSGYKPCGRCGTMMPFKRSNRRDCVGCRALKRQQTNEKWRAVYSAQRRWTIIPEPRRRCFRCSNLIPTKINAIGRLNTPSRFCSSDCRRRHEVERLLEKLAALKSDPVQWAIYLEKKRTGGDPVKRALRHERKNAVRSKRRLVVRAVRETATNSM